jgi:hypothetical protein
MEVLVETDGRGSYKELKLSPRSSKYRRCLRRRLHINSDIRSVLRVKLCQDDKPKNTTCPHKREK